MKKLSFYFGIFFVVITLLLFGGCSEKKTELPYKNIKGMHVYNNMTYCLGGLPETVLIDKRDISFVLKRVNHLKTKKDTNVFVNVHYGFFEINLMDSIHKEYHLMDIVFTEFYGDVVVYKWSKYYYDQELVDFIKKKLEIPLDRKPIIKKQ